MGMVKQFGIGNICHPNAITTLEEYLVDYASDKTKKDAEALIQRELDSIPNPEVRKSTIEKLEEIRQGQRDLYI